MRLNLYQSQRDIMERSRVTYKMIAMTERMMALLVVVVDNMDVRCVR